MADRQRVLIDWDLGAEGIWRVGRNGGAIGWKGWATVLSVRLLADLESWNDQGAEFTRSVPSVETSGFAETYRQLRAAGQRLARRVQDELGTGWEVLYNPGDEAWAWVDPPWEGLSPGTPQVGRAR